MKAIATCIKGLENITQLEIKEILKTNSEIVMPSRVKFIVKNKKELERFILYTRSSIKVYEVITRFEFDSLENLIKNAKTVKFPKIRSPFVVRCERTGEHSFNSNDVEKEVGGVIVNKNKKLKVDLHNPKTIILLDILDKNCFIGIDHTKIKLTKRDYRIRLTPNPINPVLAYSLLRLSHIKTSDKILDPFCKSGEIPIEAALYLKNIPPNKKNLEITLKQKIKNKSLYIIAADPSQNNLKSTQINSKIANVNKDIRLSRFDIEWLDTKFNKNSIDKIITFPPYPTKSIPREKIEKLYKEFFYQSEFILKQRAIITLLTPVPELIKKYAKEYKFKEENCFEMEYHKQKYFVLVFEK